MAELLHPTEEIERPHLQVIPIELIEAILHHAVEDNIFDDLPFAVSLQLVCSAARAWLLPIIYFSLIVPLPQDTSSRSAPFDFLLYLVRQREAPPRQHIRHICFVGTDQIAWSIVSGLDKAPVPWPKTLVSVAMDLQGVNLLNRLRLAPRYLFCTSLHTDTMFNLGVHSIHIATWDGLARVRGRVAGFESWRDRQRFRQLTSGAYRPSDSQLRQQAYHFHIQIEPNHKGFARLPVCPVKGLLWWRIRAITHVVLELPPADSLDMEDRVTIARVVESVREIKPEHRMRLTVVQRAGRTPKTVEEYACAVRMEHLDELWRDGVSIDEIQFDSEVALLAREKPPRSSARSSDDSEPGF